MWSHCLHTDMEMLGWFCQLPDGEMEMIILQEVVYLPGLFYLISQSQVIGKDLKVEPVNYYSLNLGNRHGKSIATAPLVEGSVSNWSRLGQQKQVGSVPDWFKNPSRCLLAGQTRTSTR